MRDLIPSFAYWLHLAGIAVYGWRAPRAWHRRSTAAEDEAS